MPDTSRSRCDVSAYLRSCPWVSAILLHPFVLLQSQHLNFSCIELYVHVPSSITQRNTRTVNALTIQPVHESTLPQILPLSGSWSYVEDLLLSSGNRGALLE